VVVVVVQGRFPCDIDPPKGKPRKRYKELVLKAYYKVGVEKEDEQRRRGFDLKVK
jgi:hypothetical protein